MDFEIQFKIHDCIVTILATILELRTQASSITDFMAEMDSISPNKLCMDHIDNIVNYTPTNFFRHFGGHLNKRLRFTIGKPVGLLSPLDLVTGKRGLITHVIKVIMSNFETRSGWTTESVMLPDLGYTWLSCLWKSNHCHHSSLGSLRITWLGERFSMPSKVSISRTVH